MIFAVGPGSEGFGPERYVASIPFVVAPGVVINSSGEELLRPMGTTKLQLDKLQLIHSLTLGPFATEFEASSALERLGAALLWSSLTLGIGIQYSHQQGAVTLFESPQSIPETEPMATIGRARGWDATDGWYDAEKAIVRPDHKRLARWEAGQATMTLGIDPERLLASLEHALTLPHLEGVISDHKLKLSIELYSAHRFEFSDNAQFLSLVTALEALLPNVEITQTAATALIDATEAIRDARDRHDRDSHDWAEINRLLSRVGSVKYEIIGTSIRQFVDSVIVRNPSLGDRDSIATSLKDAYSARSRLLHDGHFDQQEVKKQLAFLRTFLPTLLQTLFKEASAIQQ